MFRSIRIIKTWQRFFENQYGRRQRRGVCCFIISDDRNQLNTGGSLCSPIPSANEPMVEKWQQFKMVVAAILDFVATIFSAIGLS